MSDLNIFITSNLTSSERRISPQWDLDYLKQKLELITGIQPENQILQYYPNQHSNEYTTITSPSNGDALLLSSLNLRSYSRIHVLDSDPDSAVNNLDFDNEKENNDNGEEFHFPEEEYAKRQDSVLHWKKTNQLGRFNPEFNSLQEKLNSENEEKLRDMKVGQRCRVINIEGERRGEVKFIGKIESLDKGKDVWVGIEFDEPVGKNDGSIDGVRIFEARHKHGSFVKPKQVEVGDFPELDPFADEDLDEEL